MNLDSKSTLGFFPTPITELKNLSTYLTGPKLFIKRDDQTGLAFGGNKTRKLEYFIYDAIANGCDTIITGGAEQSNHCRQTAAAAAAYGLECHLVLGGNEPEKIAGNLLLDLLLHAKIHWAANYRKGEKIPIVAEELKQKGKKPYIIPYGGSNEVGALGFVNAIRELSEQINSIGNITHVVFASSSGGTHSGMIVGKKLFNLKAQLVGIAIDKEDEGYISVFQNIKELAQKTVNFLELDFDIIDEDIVLNNDYLGEGYGVVGNLERDAINLLAAKEGILVDPVYTGRAFGGLLDLINKKYFTKEDSILFWHTGGSPALFSPKYSLLK